MAVKGIATRVIWVEASPSNTLLMHWEVAYGGPEISAWSNGDQKIWITEIVFEMLGNETLAQLATKFTDTMTATLTAQTGITMLRTDCYIPSYAKGV